MTLEIAATEFVDAASTRFAYRGLGPAMVNAPRRRGSAPFCGAREGAIVNISSILALIPEFTLGIYGAKEPTKSAEQSTNPAFGTIPHGRWSGYCDENS